jgi:hypothetical protein
MRRLLPITTVLLALAACDNPGSEDVGSLQGSLAGAPWNGPARFRAGPADQGMLESRIRTGAGTRRIVVEFPWTAPGEYAVPAGSGWYGVEPASGDANYATVSGGTVSVTRATADEVRGSLVLEFEGMGQVIEFSGGTFRVPIEDGIISP